MEGIAVPARLAIIRPLKCLLDKDIFKEGCLLQERLFEENNGN